VATFARESLKGRKERARKVFDRLRAHYPDAECSLDYKNPLELLVSTILAAQCTDARVNKVTKDLFKKYKTCEDYVSAAPETLEKEIQTCGFFRQKTRSIQDACRSIIDEFGGKVPGTMEELLRLKGVGRKTANVVLGQCFGEAAIIVDTHCRRVTNRLAFTKSDDPAKIERDLMTVWDKEHWTLFSHLMVFHGRSICVARSPKCSQCPVNDLCPYPHTAAGKKVAR
jgi:endonuclease III